MTDETLTPEESAPDAEEAPAPHGEYADGAIVASYSATITLRKRAGATETDIEPVRIRDLVAVLEEAIIFDRPYLTAHLTDVKRTDI